MKLLFEEHLPYKLPFRLADVFPGSKHVCEEGLSRTSDSGILDHARLNHFIVVTTDADFFSPASNSGPPPQVIWLRECRHPTCDVESLLRQEIPRIKAFSADSELGILVLDKLW